MQTVTHIHVWNCICNAITVRQNNMKDYSCFSNSYVYRDLFTSNFGSLTAATIWLRIKIAQDPGLPSGSIPSSQCDGILFCVEYVIMNFTQC